MSTVGPMAPHGNRRAPLVARAGFGVAELRPDPRHPQGWTLLVDGVPQSYVDLADPEHLEFGYLRRLGTVMRLWRPLPVPLTVLHLGGGGLALPRLIAHLRPGSAQRVVERDGPLLELITRLLPPPAGVELVVGDARAELERAPAAAYDVVLADVFAGGWMPDSLATSGFAAAAERALRPGGLLAMNLTDVPPMARMKVQVATAGAAFADVCLLAERDVLRGRTAGNAVLAASAALGDLPARTGALHGRALTEFRAGARARLDEPA
jgi:hypothetical protein